jgi:hypothetical protein
MLDTTVRNKKNSDGQVHDPCVSALTSAMFKGKSVSFFMKGGYISLYMDIFSLQCSGAYIEAKHCIIN